jgi:phospholipase/carboxylesterase
MSTTSRLAPLMGPAHQLIVLLHGRGSNARDLISLAQYWQDALPHAAFVSLEGPLACEGAPPSCRQWFDLGEWEPPMLLSAQTHCLPEMAITAAQVERLIQQELQNNHLDADQLAFMGFSQGAMMALYLGLTRAQPCAGILAYGGALLCEEVLLQSKPPVFLYHGGSDDVVIPKELDLAKEKLARWGVPTHTTLRPRLGHGIDETGLAQGAAFLKKIFMSKTTNAA